MRVVYFVGPNAKQAVAEGEVFSAYWQAARQCEETGEKVFEVTLTGTATREIK